MDTNVDIDKSSWRIRINILFLLKMKEVHGYRFIIIIQITNYLHEHLEVKLFTFVSRAFCMSTTLERVWHENLTARAAYCRIALSYFDDSQLTSNNFI